MRKVLRTLLKSIALPCVLSALVATASAADPRQYAVEVSAAVQTVPPQITLRWAPDSAATGYTVYRKTLAGTSWSLLANLGNVNSWSDQSVANGSAYEYSIQKTTSIGYRGTGYIYAGINAPMTESRGKCILVVDNTHASQLASELSRLQQDLVGDGWTVIRKDVSRSDTAITVKNLIKAEYNADPSNVKSVFLFGHVAVPYSGNFNPDGHPDHVGAWVADTYYGEMNGTWTDSSVNNTSASKPYNHNVPGDGKFDQTDLPSDIDLHVGRVDLYNMTCYANKANSRSELDLLRGYLNKHNNFRHGRIQLNRRGLVSDNFGERNGEAFAATGWRSFAPFFGAENNVAVPAWTYFNTLKDQPYLWSYGTGGGSWYTCDGVGSSDDFANYDIKSVFTAYLGSYFGDWDNESNFMRASLGSGYVLATAWGGRPHWFFHHMGLGEPIGHSAKISQNNGSGGLYGAANYGSRRVHVSLLGDPTLRMHPVIPPSNVSATVASGGVNVTWSASSDANIQGYVVYRGSSANGPFTRVSGSGYLSGGSFFDSGAAAGAVYMVRAVKLEQSGSGTYYNPSQGIFATAGGTAPAPSPTPTPSTPAAPSNLAVYVNSGTSVTIYWKDNSSDESGFRIVRKAGASGTPTLLNITANVIGHMDNALLPGTQYHYQVYAWNAAGNSAPTAEVVVTTPSIVQTGTPAAPTALVAYVNSGSSLTLYWKDNSQNESGFRIVRKTGVNGPSTVIDMTPNIIGYMDNALTAGTQYFYQVYAWNAAGNSAPTAEVAVTTPGTPPPAPTGSQVRYLGLNTTTRGNWKGTFGSQGYQVITESASIPSYATVTPSGKSDHIWNWYASDLTALQKGSVAERVAACWYSGSVFDVRVNITDGQAHKVSFYAADWDQGSRTQRVDLLDATGTIVHTVNLSSFQGGAYVSYDVKGNVTFRFTRTGGPNAVVSGIFFDAPSAPL